MVANDALKAVGGMPTAVVDYSVLDALGLIQGTGKPEFVDRIITMFIDTALALIAELNHASAENEIAKLHHASHALKSCSAIVGAANLTSSCQELEAMARTGAVPDAAARVESIVQEYLLVQAALISRLARRKPSSGITDHPKVPSSGRVARSAATPRFKSLRMHANFSGDPQNRLDFIGHQSVHAQGRPRPF